jgi:hypothetical protein
MFLVIEDIVFSYSIGSFIQIYPAPFLGAYRKIIDERVVVNVQMVDEARRSTTMSIYPAVRTHDVIPDRDVIRITFNHPALTTLSRALILQVIAVVPFE